MSRWHAGSIRFLEDAINENAPAVVISHFSPTFSMQNPSFAGDALTSYFQNDLDELIGLGVSLWVYGHNHHSCDRVVSGTRVVSNQRGYPGERTGFDAGKTVDIPTPALPR
ncbi:metallophosphoesterase [Salinisphaera sp. S4-8]